MVELLNAPIPDSILPQTELLQIGDREVKKINNVFEIIACCVNAMHLAVAP